MRASSARVDCKRRFIAAKRHADSRREPWGACDSIVAQLNGTCCSISSAGGNASSNASFTLLQAVDEGAEAAGDR